MKDYAIGLIGLILIIIIVWRLVGLPNKYSNNLRTIIRNVVIGITSSLIIFLVLNYFYKIPGLEVSALEAIIFTIITIPLLEEILYRRILLQWNLNNLEFSLTYFGKSLLIGIILILPTLILWIFRIINLSHPKFLLLIIVLCLIPSLSILSKNKLFFKIMCLISNALIFTLMHNDYAARALIYTGIYYATLYYLSNSMVTSWVAHVTINSLVLLNQIS